MRGFTPTNRLFLAEAIVDETAKAARVMSGVSCNSCFSFVTVWRLVLVVSPGLPQTRVTGTTGCGAARGGLAPSSATGLMRKAQTKHHRWLCCFPSGPGAAGWQRVALVGCPQMSEGFLHHKHYLQSSGAHVTSSQSQRDITVLGSFYAFFLPSDEIQDCVGSFLAGWLFPHKLNSVFLSGQSYTMIFV